MNISLVRKVEIAFWDFIIQTLSENDHVRALIQKGYRLLHSAEIRRLAGYLAASAAAGLLSGILLFILMTF